MAGSVVLNGVVSSLYMRGYDVQLFFLQLLYGQRAIERFLDKAS